MSDRIVPGLSEARIRELADEAAEVLGDKACGATLGPGEIFYETQAAHLLVTAFNMATSEAHAAGAAAERARWEALIEAEAQRRELNGDDPDVLAALNYLLEKVNEA